MTPTLARTARRAAISGLAALGLVAVMTMPALATKGDPHKATICHATHSETNPYVEITVDYAAIDGEKNNDHSHHVGPVWFPGAKAAGIDWGDIIPVVPGVNPGQNLADGQDILDNGCVPPNTPAQPTPTPGGGVQGGNPTPTPGGGVQGGNPTPTPAPLPDTAMGGGAAVPTVLLSLLLVASLAVMTVLRVARQR